MLVVVYLEEGGALQHTGGAAHLPDGVHGQLRSADVHHGNAETGRQDGSDGGPTGAVVTNHHILRGWGGQQTISSLQPSCPLLVLRCPERPLVDKTLLVLRLNNLNATFNNFTYNYICITFFNYK